MKTSVFFSPWPPKVQLFNLAEDIGEKRDLAAEKPELAERLHTAWRDWSAKLPAKATPAAAKAAPGSAKPPQDRAALFALKDKDHDLGGIRTEPGLRGVCTHPASETAGDSVRN